MIPIDIPGFKPMRIEHVLLDYNGTIAFDGQLVPGVEELIRELTNHAHVVVLTADTYGTVQQQCAHLGVDVLTFPRAGATRFKLEYTAQLEGDVACLGNGRNDAGMFDHSTLSIAVMNGEGIHAALLAHADILTRSATEALGLLLHTDRIRATLRS